MSLLDQLSSLCIQSSNINYKSTFLSFNNNQHLHLNHIPHYNHISHQNHIQLTSSNHQYHQTINNNVYSLNKEVDSQNKEGDLQNKVDLQNKIESQNKYKNKRQSQHNSYSQQHNNNSQKKMIKLFDDQQLQPGWRLIKTDIKYKSKQSKQYKNINNKYENKLSQFNINEYCQIDQSLSMSNEVKVRYKASKQQIYGKLTKISYLVNNKIRRLDYQFFIKLQKYSQLKIKQQQQKVIQKQKIKYLTYQKGINKLQQTFNILNLKYFKSLSLQTKNNNNNSYQQQQQQNIIINNNKKYQSFIKIFQYSKLCQEVNIINKIINKCIYRKFYNRLQKHNQLIIKIDLFYTILTNIFNTKNLSNTKVLFSNIKLHYIKSNHYIQSIQNTNYHNNQSLRKYYSTNYQQVYNFQQYEQPYKNNQKEYLYEQSLLIGYNNNIAHNNNINLNRYPLIYVVNKASNPGFVLQNGINNRGFQIDIRQNIPLKLHSIKSQQQQLNINDIVDNGHLLMNQLQSNIKFKQQLQNLTLSNINSKTTNSSINNSIIGDFILPQFNYQQKLGGKYYDQQKLGKYENNYQDQQDQQNNQQYQYKNKAITMRKQNKISQNIITNKPYQQTTLIKQIKQIKQINKQRKSLLITKRKQSSIDLFNHHNHQYHQYQNFNQNISFLSKNNHKLTVQPKKNKSTTNSSSKIQKKQPSNSDKQIIKKMLDQLNKKFNSQNKHIQINLSNKKQTITNNKQSNSINNKSQNTTTILSNKKQPNTSTILSTKKQPNTNNKSSTKKQQNTNNKSSNKKVQRIKVNKSQFQNNTNKKSNTKLNQISQPKSTKNDIYRIDLVQKKRNNSISLQQNNLTHNNNQSNCFMSVTINNTNNYQSLLNKNQQKITKFDNQNIPKQKIKQSYSELSKNNFSKRKSQVSQQNQICKILSKYRTKKPLIPQSSMKIDLVSSKINKAMSISSISDQQKNKILSHKAQNMYKENQRHPFYSQKIVDNSQYLQENDLRLNNDSFFIQRNSTNHLLSETQSLVGDYPNFIPSNIYLQQNQQQNDYMHYVSQKASQTVNTSLDTTQCFYTGSKPKLSKPSTINSSMQKKRKSFEKSRDEWDVMFEKQKNKFLKNESNSKIIKKKSTLNQQVINEIKNKIEQCLILNQKNTNIFKGYELKGKKSIQGGSYTEDKNIIAGSLKNSIKVLSSSNSRRNSINSLQGTSKLIRRQQN